MGTRQSEKGQCSDRTVGSLTTQAVRVEPHYPSIRTSKTAEFFPQDRLNLEGPTFTLELQAKGLLPKDPHVPRQQSSTERVF